MISSSKNLIKKLIRLIRINPGDRLFWTGKDGECPNFGDFISPYLFTKITGRQPIFSHPSNLSIYSVYMSVGSIMSWCRENSVIWGSGIVTNGQTFPKPKAVYAVRGPITREHFVAQGYNCPEVYGDPGLLMPVFYNKSGTPQKYRIGIVPHYVDRKIAKQLIPDSKSILFIDVFDPIEKVIDDICTCETIISSSLHGIIMAQAYNIPAAWCKFSDKLWGDDVKFYDYFLSLSIKHGKPYYIRQILNEKEINKIEKTAINADRTKLYELQKSLIENCPFKTKSLDNLRLNLEER